MKGNFRKYALKTENACNFQTIHPIFFPKVPFFRPNKFLGRKELKRAKYFSVFVSASLKAKNLEPLPGNFEGLNEKVYTLRFLISDF